MTNENKLESMVGKIKESCLNLIGDLGQKYQLYRINRAEKRKDKFLNNEKKYLEKIEVLGIFQPSLDFQQSPKDAKKYRELEYAIRIYAISVAGDRQNVNYHGLKPIAS